jgi:sodium-independent sulfate anion transporter 11
VAGGFGYGNSHSKHPREVAAIVPYSLPQDKVSDGSLKQCESDLESGDTKIQVQEVERDAETRNWEPLLPEETPFFHLDLLSAVRAAESGLDRIEDVGSEKAEDGSSEIQVVPAEAA